MSNIKDHQQILIQALNIYDDIIIYGNILNKVENQYILINVINPTDNKQFVSRIYRAVIWNNKWGINKKYTNRTNALFVRLTTKAVINLNNV